MFQLLMFFIHEITLHVGVNNSVAVKALRKGLSATGVKQSFNEEMYRVYTQYE